MYNTQCITDYINPEVHACGMRGGSLIHLLSLIFRSIGSSLRNYHHRHVIRGVVPGGIMCHWFLIDSLVSNVGPVVVHPAV